MNRCPYRLVAGAACMAVSKPCHEPKTARMVSRPTIIGIGELAEELGVNRQSIWAVMNGSRTSKRLHEELTARGFSPAPMRTRKRKTRKSSVAK